MNLQEVFVGIVSVVLGTLAVLGAISNSDWYYQLDKVRWIESQWGRLGARAVYGLLGVSLILLGVAIAMGFGPNKKSGSHRSSRGEWTFVHGSWFVPSTANSN